MSTVCSQPKPGFCRVGDRDATGNKERYCLKSDQRVQRCCRLLSSLISSHAPVQRNSEPRPGAALIPVHAVPAEVQRSHTKHLRAKDLSLPLPALIPPGFQVQNQVQILQRENGLLNCCLGLGLWGHRRNTLTPPLP